MGWLGLFDPSTFKDEFLLGLSVQQGYGFLNKKTSLFYIVGILSCIYLGIWAAES